MGMTGIYESFADYKDRMTGANIDRRSVAEILADLLELEDVTSERAENGRVAVEIANREQPPVYTGMTKPLWRAPMTGENAHGKDLSLNCIN